MEATDTTNKRNADDAGLDDDPIQNDDVSEVLANGDTASKRQKVEPTLSDVLAQILETVKESENRLLHRLDTLAEEVNTTVTNLTAMVQTLQATIAAEGPALLAIQRAVTEQSASHLNMRGMLSDLASMAASPQMQRFQTAARVFLQDRSAAPTSAALPAGTPFPILTPVAGVPQIANAQQIARVPLADHGTLFMAAPTSAAGPSTPNGTAVTSTARNPVPSYTPSAQHFNPAGIVPILPTGVLTTVVTMPPSASVSSVSSSGQSANSPTPALAISNSPAPTLDLDPPNSPVLIESHSGLPITPLSGAIPGTAYLSATTTPSIPMYKLHRNLPSIIDVWEEYDKGLEGNPPIRYLESTYKAAWRNTPTARKYFSRRNVIYKAVQKMMTERNITGDTAAAALEAMRRQLNLGMHKFMQYLIDNKMC